MKKIRHVRTSSTSILDRSSARCPPSEDVERGIKKEKERERVCVCVRERERVRERKRKRK